MNKPKHNSEHVPELSDLRHSYCSSIHLTCKLPY